MAGPTNIVAAAAPPTIAKSKRKRKSLVAQQWKEEERECGCGAVRAGGRAGFRVGPSSSFSSAASFFLSYRSLPRLLSFTNRAPGAIQVQPASQPFEEGGCAVTDVKTAPRDSPGYIIARPSVRPSGRPPSRLFGLDGRKLVPTRRQLC